MMLVLNGVKPTAASSRINFGVSSYDRFSVVRYALEEIVCVVLPDMNII